MKRLNHALTFAALLLGTCLWAQEAPASAEVPAPKPLRELFTTGAGVTDPGVVVLDAGAQVSYDRDSSRARRFPTQIDFGICQWIDVRASWGGPTTLRDVQGSSQSGGADPLIGGQFQGLRQEKAGVDLGLAYWHKLPRASVEKGIGTGKADDTLVVAASRTDGPWEFDVNAGANWLGRTDADGRIRQGVLSLAVTRVFSGGWNVSLDNYALAATELGPRTVTSILGVSRDLTSNLTVDVALEAGLTHSGERLAIDAGLAWRMGRLWGQNQTGGW